MRSTSDGFLLPLVLLLSLPLLVLAVTALERSQQLALHRERAALHRQARESLLVNAGQIIGFLERRLAEGGTSALLPADGEGENRLHPMLLQVDGEVPLASINTSGSVQRSAFRSPHAPGRLAAEWVGTDRAGSPNLLAWAAEDIGLGAGLLQPPPFWPLPAWNLAPVPGKRESTRLMDELTKGAWRACRPVPRSQALRMEPAEPASPLPVIEQLDLRFGIFASGPPRSREKPLRIRFYLSGIVWNPYNRELQAHPGRGLSPVFRVVFWNLPEVRIHNLTRGVSTGWISLDRAANDWTGQRGIHAWVRLPADLPQGERISFLEPDSGWQPQGLARTLHPGLLLGPADRVKIAWRQPEGGLHAACLPMDRSDPLEAALAGEGWFRAEGFPVGLPDLVYPRADYGPSPFYLKEGSLSFRRNHARASLSFRSGPAAMALVCDPRQRSVSGDEPWIGVDGETHAPVERLRLITGIDPPESTSARKPVEAVFSWPASRPEGLVEAMDLPLWKDGFRLGSADAGELNRFLDRPEAWSVSAPSGREVLREESRRPAFPVNLSGEEAWEDLLRRAGDSAGGAGSTRFPLFSWPVGDETGNYGDWPGTALLRAARTLAAKAREDPVASVGAFFDKGRLADAFPVLRDAVRKHPLLPLRAWLRGGPVPVPAGRAWILHLASVRSRNGYSTTISARIWLLLQQPPNGVARFRVIRLEWTDPEAHLPPTGA